jgi:hypothetical protein
MMVIIFTVRPSSIRLKHYHEFFTGILTKWSDAPLPKSNSSRIETVPNRERRVPPQPSAAPIQIFVDNHCETESVVTAAAKESLNHRPGSHLTKISN